jgi:CRP/FNR family transcriptional regulator, cyclic AMP receptor protein
LQETPDLRDLPLFGHLNEEELEAISRAARAASFAPGEAIFEEGGPEDTLYALASGSVEVHKKVLARRRQHLATLRAPTVVGEMGLLSGPRDFEPRAAATVSARTRVEGYGIPRALLLEMVEKEEPAAYKVVHEIGRTLAERMAKTDERIVTLTGELEDADRDNTDLAVFQDRLIREWSF